MNSDVEYSELTNMVVMTVQPQLAGFMFQATALLIHSMQANEQELPLKFRHDLNHFLKQCTKIGKRYDI